MNRQLLAVFLFFSYSLSPFFLWAAGGGEARFIENKGQWNEKVVFKADVGQGSLFLEKNCFTYSFYDNSAIAKMHLGEILPEAEWKIKYHAFKIHFLNSSGKTGVSGSRPGEEYYNYYQGNDRSRWASGARAYTEISYKNMYEGIDLRLYTQDGNLKYDFIVSPGANPAGINMQYEGVERIFLKNGGLVIKTSVNEITEQKPFAYQVVNGKKSEVKCAFFLTPSPTGEKGEGLVSFTLSAYNKSLPLIIDPTLIFASYSGSTASNFGMTATYDNAGNFYAGGMAFNNGYPTTVGAFDLTFNNTTTGNGISDVVITKYNSPGSNLIYSTYLGGNGTETVHSLIVNGQDELFLYGVTSSTDFPLSSNAYDNSFGGGASLNFPQNGTSFSTGTDIYVTKFNAAGSALLGSTYIGGSANDGVNYNDNATLYDSLLHNYGDQFRGEIMIDDLGNCYVATTTRSVDFPVVNGFQNALNGSQDAVVFKFNSDLSNLTWSTYLGGSNKDAAYSVKLDSSYNVYVAGGTSSPDFPADTASVNPSYLGGKTDGYIVKISGSGASLLSGTFIGTSAYDQCFFVELDEDSNVYLVGQTLGSFPVSPGVYSNPNSPQFIIKLSNALDSVYYSTVFGNGSLSKVNISPSAFLVDDCRNVYVSGWGASILQGSPLSGMPVTSDALFPASPNGFDFYLFVMSGNASSLIYATYFGGGTSREHVDGGTSRFDKRGVVYQSVCAGCGGNSDFPTTSGAWSNLNLSSNCNNGTFKFDFQILPFASLVSSSSQCDSCTGTAIISASGGISPYTYQWDSQAGNSTSSSLTGLCEGSYEVTITDSAGCSSALDVSIPAALGLAVSSPQDISCADFCNGEVTVIADGGTPPYSYLWSDSSASATLTGACAGTYSVTVTDANLCTGAISYSFTDPPPFSFLSSAQTNIQCNGDSSGQISVSAGGGVPPYSFLWSNNSASSQLANLPSQVYSVTITDANGCAIDTSFSITQPSALSLTMNSTNETCSGLCNGTAEISVAGATSPYSYSWSNNSTSPLVTGLCPGTYFVTVTDANNCLKADTVIVDAANFQAVLTGADNSSCQNCNGSATASPGGGLSPYSYLWSDSSVTPSITGLCAGTYTVTVTDFTGCDTAASVLVNDPSNMELLLADSVNILCNGLCTGEASTVVSGGTGPFSYLWSNGQTTSSVSGLCAGTFLLTVTDANECKRFLSVDISEPPQLLISALNYTNISCYGEDNGSATINVTGGTSPYAYLWSHGAVQSQVSGLPPQDYSVTITDSNNCPADTAFEITQPPPLETAAGSSPQGCFLNCDGSASVSASGGTPVYSYLWSNNSISAVAEGLCPGTYFITVTDANGCVKMDTATVDSSVFIPQAISLSADTTTIYEGESTVLHALFDTSANYQWSPVVGLSNINVPDPAASPSVTTTYVFTVSSPSDPLCSYSDSITIFVVEQICGEPDIFVSNAFTPNNDNHNDRVFVRGNYIRKMHFVIYDRWGEKMFETENQGEGWDGTYNGMKCDPAVFVYYLTVTCIDEQEFFKKGNITLIR